MGMSLSGINREILGNYIVTALYPIVLHLRIRSAILSTLATFASMKGHIYVYMWYPGRPGILFRLD